MQPRTSRTLAAAALAWLAMSACQDALRPPVDGAHQGPSFHLSSDQAVRMTGGGRIDAPPGTAEKNPPKSKIFQTFAFNVGDKNADGLPEGELEFVDHTPANRVDGRPLNLKAVAWHTFGRVADDCADAAIEATGTLEVKHTGEELEFRLYACDNGEPGTKSPHDRLELDVLDGAGNIRWSWHGLLTGGNLQAHFDKPPKTVPTTGDLEVVASTTGEDLDPDGYTVTVDDIQTERVATNDRVTFTGLAAGDHEVLLGDVADNCTVSGENSRTVTVRAGETTSTTFDVTCEGQPPPPPPGGVRITGLGTIGAGSATAGSDRQEFDFDVASDLTGRLFYRDWSVVATIIVDPSTDPETGIRRFRDGSTACADFTRGAEFDATGRLDNGDLIGIIVVACDNGTPGTGVDFFRLDAPFISTPYSRSGLLTSGEIVKSGEGTPRPMGVRVTGVGQLGTGLPMLGNDVQTFEFDVSSDLVGSKFYADFAIIRPDGTVGTLTVDPADMRTRITVFRDGSAACAEFARGVEFEGIGRVNSGGANPGTDEFLPFTARTCDNATPGTGADFYELILFFGNFTVRYQKAGVLTAGDILKSRM